MQDFDSDEFIFQRKKALNHFFGKVFQELVKQPYSLHFFLSLPRFAIKDDTHTEHLFEIMAQCLKAITDEDIDMLLYYDTETAL